MVFFKTKKERLQARSDKLSMRLGAAKERASIADKITKDRKALAALQKKEKSAFGVNPAFKRNLKSGVNTFLAAAERQRKFNEQQERKQTPPNTLF